MKNKNYSMFILSACLVLRFGQAFGGGVSIGDEDTAPNDNAMLDINSPTNGAGKGLLIPRMTELQRTQASSALDGGLLDDSGDLRSGQPAQGLLVYQTDGSQGFYYNTSTDTTPSWVYLDTSSAISAFGYCYLLTNDGTIAGGENIVLSNNGPLSGITHTANTATMTVPTTGNYLVHYSISTTGGVGAQLAVAVNGSVKPSTPVNVLATGNLSGSAILLLTAGDVLTLRNNSSTALTLALSPAVGAQCNIMKLD